MDTTKGWHDFGREMNTTKRQLDDIDYVIAIKPLYISAGRGMEIGQGQHWWGLGQRVVEYC